MVNQASLWRSEQLRLAAETVAGAAAQAAQLLAVGDRQHSCFIVGATAVTRCFSLGCLAGCFQVIGCSSFGVDKNMALVAS